MDCVMIEELIVLMFVQFIVYVCNFVYNLVMGGDYIVFFCVVSIFNVVDWDGGWWFGNQIDYCNFLKFVQFFNIIYCVMGYLVELVDLYVLIWYFDCVVDMIWLMDKVFYIYFFGKECNCDGLEMICIVMGLLEEEFCKILSVIIVINLFLLLWLDMFMLQGLIEMVWVGQVSVLMLFILVGVMVFVIIVGVLMLQNVEVLVGIVFMQVICLGVFLVYGGFIFNVDMKLGVFVFGILEYIKVVLVSGQLVWWYNLLFCIFGVCVVNIVDYQVVMEIILLEWGVINGGGNLIKYVVGWLEGGLLVGFEKFIIDVDFLQMFVEYLILFDVLDEVLVFDVICDVGLVGYFFGIEYIQVCYKDVFYVLIVFDWCNYEIWVEVGSLIVYDKVNMFYKKVLEVYEQFVFDFVIDEELIVFVVKWKEEGGVLIDF